ncbi:hypothetical protein [Sphingomonas sp.]|uniref:hypothetical protein n=1 Tax=Sphingomonas sp. TaxID=28214 RepID=UPI001E14CC66|nr:hypothetical protein [Sphingomonas sp.]MBX9796821.1 hypothetical protein [Sphingomonas sp.]
MAWLLSLCRATMLLLAAALLASCASIRLVPAYDEQIDAGLTTLYGDTSAFVERMIESAGTPVGSYDANRSFYDSADARVAALVVRAEAHRVLKDCPSPAIITRALDNAQIPAEVRGAIGSLPRDDCQVVLMRLIGTGFQTMRKIHELRGARGLPPEARDQFLTGGVGAQLRAAITVEIAKRAR